MPKTVKVRAHKRRPPRRGGGCCSCSTIMLVLVGLSLIFLLGRFVIARSGVSNNR